LPQGFHHIQMGNEQDGLARTAPMQTDDEVFLVRLWPIDVDILSGEACGPKTLSHSFGRCRHVASWCVSRVDFNELFKNVACSLMFR